jgi:hypothetical protein
MRQPWIIAAFRRRMARSVGSWLRFCAPLESFGPIRRPVGAK